MYCIYIDQTEYDGGFNGVHSSSAGFLPLDRKAEDIVWPGDDAVSAVQGLQDRYPYYRGDEFLVGRVDGSGRPNSLERVRVNDSGRAERV